MHFSYVRPAANSLGRHLLLAAVLGSIASPVSADEPQEPWRRVTSSIGLLSRTVPSKPLAPESESELWRSQFRMLEEQAGRPLTPPEIRLWERRDDGRWKKFSDDWVQFEVPDDPLLKVTTHVPSDRAKMPVLGGDTGDEKLTYARAYCLTVGERLPYAILLVSQRDWFESRSCFCGPISLRSYVHADGVLYAFSQMPHGEVKIIQALNDTHNAVLYEWTHSAVTQEAYVRIGASLRFKKPSARSRDEWIAWARRHEASDFGWLAPRMPRREILELLGEPRESTAEELVYVRETRDQDGGGERWTFRLPLRDGRLDYFTARWSSKEPIEPRRGTLSWIEQTLNKLARDSQKPDDATARFMFGQFLRVAPTTKDRDWSRWCEVVASLGKLGFEDEAVLALVERRGRDETLPLYGVLQVFQAYQRPFDVRLVERRLNYLLGPLDPALGAPGVLEDLDQLFEILGAKKRTNSKDAAAVAADAATDELIRRALAHSDAGIRRPAWSASGRLRRQEVRELHRKRLMDADEDIRWRAQLVIPDVYEASEIPWLRKLADEAKSQRERETIEQGIEDLSRSPSR